MMPTTPFFEPSPALPSGPCGLCKVAKCPDESILALKMDKKCVARVASIVIHRHYDHLWQKRPKPSEGAKG